MDFNYFLSVLGLVLVIEGVPYFVCPDKVKRFLAQVPSVPDLYLRGFGLTAVFLGLALLYLARMRTGLL